MTDETNNTTEQVREAFEKAEDVDTVWDSQYKDFEAVVYATNPIQGTGLDRLREETGVDFDTSDVRFVKNGNAVAVGIRVPNSTSA